MESEEAASLREHQDWNFLLQVLEGTALPGDLRNDVCSG